MCWPPRRCGSASRRPCASPWTARSGRRCTGKDVILAIIAQIGAAGATGHVIEYAGSAIRGLSMEGRLTLCNMSIEAGGRAGMVAPDETTFDYLARPALCAEGRGLGPGRGALARAAERPGRRLRHRGHGGRQRHPAHGHLGQQPGGRAADRRQRPRPGRGAGCRAPRPDGAHAGLYGPRPRHGAGSRSPSTASSSAPAPIPASRTCAPPPPWRKGRKVADGVAAWVVPGQRAGEAPGRGRGAGHASSPPPASTGGEPGCSMCLGTNGDIGRAGGARRLHLATAISWAARGRARGPIC